ncbi:hypothetical protein, conserved [Eimeria maxima]|uniref:Uncharacterized protein n=1 Tax=Eimeria maxima TaxID=5804 RepID=U6MAU6_EIMMA|nr:hypothetical protein, conserved [Eimeria maxima]CDJ58790.1 hypothetical protein, conserved [Eimeria maxima]
MAATAVPRSRLSLASDLVDAAGGASPPPLLPTEVPPASEEEATAGASEGSSLSASTGTLAAATAAVPAEDAPLAAQRRLSATESALAASRRPLFLTYSLICATDASALLHQKDRVRLARQLDELLQLHQFVVLLRQPSRRASLIGPFSCSSSSSNSITTDLAIQLDPAEDSAVKDTPAFSCSSNNSCNNRKSSSTSLIGTERAFPVEECKGEEAAEASRVSVCGVPPAAAAAAPSIPYEPTTLGQHQQQQLQHMQEEAVAAAHLIAVEYFVAAVTFCKRTGFTPRAVSAFLALLLGMYRQSVQQQLSPAAAFEAFKALLLQHAVHRPPCATAVFAPQHLLPASEFFMLHFVRLLPHMQQLHTPQLPQQ